ncbi:MAG TPA: hypothetical protein PK992_09415 [Planctomycetaceae bacterium]|nr:hypothetical protein [Planctomycetaceae bacterium]
MKFFATAPANVEANGVEAKARDDGYGPLKAKEARLLIKAGLLISRQLIAEYWVTDAA